MTASGAPRRRIALAGLGRAAREIHLPAYRSLQGVELVGGADPAADAAHFDFPLYSSVEQLLEETRPEILAVAAPPAEHLALTRAGLAAGCHVFCEKPLAPDLDQADEICALARQSGRWVVVNNQYRFMEIHAAARRRIGTPDFGELVFLSASQTFYTSPTTEAGWRGRDARRTCMDFGIHVLDLCRFFFDEEPCAITARMPRPGDAAGPDYLNLIQLEFSGDRVAQVVLDRLSRGRHRYLALRLDGTAGCIESQIGGGVRVHAGVRGGSRRPYLELDLALGGRARLFHGERFVKIASEPFGVFATATRRLLEAFLQALDRGHTPPCNAEDSRRTLALVLAAYESDRRRETIALKA